MYKLKIGYYTAKDIELPKMLINSQNVPRETEIIKIRKDVRNKLTWAVEIEEFILQVVAVHYIIKSPENDVETVVLANVLGDKIITKEEI